MFDEQESQELAALDEEMEKEKEKKKLQGLTEDEMMKVMDDLKKQQDAKRRVCEDTLSCH